MDEDVVDLGGDSLAPALVPVEELADCAATALEADGARILSYGTGAGYTPLRELIAERYGVHPYRVLVTNGWLQGFSLITQGRIRGANVICEYPTYDRALQAIFQGNANLLYLDLGPGGVQQRPDRVLRPHDPEAGALLHDPDLPQPHRVVALARPALPPRELGAQPRRDADGRGRHLRAASLRR